MTARTFAGHELAARTWYYLSMFPGERGLAARRFRELESACPPEDLRLDVIAELAREGYHAKALTDRVVRDRASRIARESAPDRVMLRKVDELIANAARAIVRRTPFAEAAGVAVRRSHAERRHRR